MDKKERIFEAAHEILGEQGFYGLSIAVVAKKAKVAAGTIPSIAISATRMT
ncbi:hypothetical protein KAM339_000230 [Aeromonas caviae]|nr:hypothetical protein KAM339_000230 [Aeromonas caviae]